MADCLPAGEQHSGECSFSLPDASFRIDTTGQGIRTDIHGEKKKFTLPLGESGLIRAMQYYDFNGDIILLYAFADDHERGGWVIRLCGRTCQVKWGQQVPGPNLSLGTLEGRYLYLAARGFISKIDLETGSFKWKHEGLYDQSTGVFVAFDTPYLETDDVTFKSAVADSGRFRVIRANKELGTLTVQ